MSRKRSHGSIDCTTVNPTDGPDAQDKARRKENVPPSAKRRNQGLNIKDSAPFAKDASPIETSVLSDLPDTSSPKLKRVEKRCWTPDAQEPEEPVVGLSPVPSTVNTTSRDQPPCKKPRPTNRPAPRIICPPFPGRNTNAIPPTFSTPAMSPVVSAAGPSTPSVVKHSSSPAQTPILLPYSSLHKVSDNQPSTTDTPSPASSIASTIKMESPEPPKSVPTPVQDIVVEFQREGYMCTFGISSTKEYYRMAHKVRSPLKARSLTNFKTWLNTTNPTPVYLKRKFFAPVEPYLGPTLHPITAGPGSRNDTVQDVRMNNEATTISEQLAEARATGILPPAISTKQTMDHPSYCACEDCTLESAVFPSRPVAVSQPRSSPVLPSRSLAVFPPFPPRSGPVLPSGSGAHFARRRARSCPAAKRPWKKPQLSPGPGQEITPKETNLLLAFGLGHHAFNDLYKSISKERKRSIPKNGDVRNHPLPRTGRHHPGWAAHSGVDGSGHMYSLSMAKKQRRIEANAGLRHRCTWIPVTRSLFTKKEIGIPEIVLTTPEGGQFSLVDMTQYKEPGVQVLKDGDDQAGAKMDWGEELAEIGKVFREDNFCGVLFAMLNRG